MTEELKPGLLTLQVGGRTFEIKISFALIRRVEEHTGKPILAAAQDAADHLGYGLTRLVTLVQFMLPQEKDGPTLDQVGDAILAHGPKDFAQRVCLFLGNAYMGHKDAIKFEAKDEGNVPSAGPDA